jgi:hypothetical protein
MTQETIPSPNHQSRRRPAGSSPVKAFHVHRWVLWWFYVGVVCGIVAVANMLFRDLSRTQEHVLIFLGTMHWLLGGLVCWACEGIRTQKPTQPSEERHLESAPREEEWHAASEFLFPGRGHTLLPPSRAQQSREMLDIYLLEHPEQTPGH